MSTFHSSARSAARPQGLGIEASWSRSVAEVAEALHVDLGAGLDADEVTRRARQWGENRIAPRKPKSLLQIWLDQFRSVLVALLAAAMVAAAAVGQGIEALAILGVLLVNAAIGFFMERQAVRSLEALRRLGTADATALRGGRPQRVPAPQLVPGDVVRVEGGDVVAADLRLTESSRLEVDEAMLTGESLPRAKRPDPVSPEADLSERTSMLFKGTVVARGSGAGVVVATGMHTELGTISKMVEGTEEPSTPLERRLARLAHGLMALTLVIAALIGTGALFSGSSPLLVIQTSIALAVATVPEGLPIIATITLARGMLRLVGHQALVQRLAAIETLGSTSILCTDKTGTLTENRLRVQDILPHEGIPEARHRCLEVGLLCNNASLPHDGEPAVGDPLEVALLAAARDAGIEREGLLARWPRVREVAFDAESRRMVTVHGHAAPHRLAVKGAPEAILDACDLDAASRSEWAQRAEAMATRGLRVLGMAEVRRDDPKAPAEHLQLLGLVGMWDPPSPGASSTVRAFRTAGVQVVMATGDHPATARHVATAVGLPNAETVWLGRDLESARSAPLERQENLRKGCVFARVSPKQKLELIALHQSAGSVVAMTGDGVNDAPALKRADIGVAMGGRGSEAAREASDMVLRDDNLATIVTAIGEGRTIFANIRGFAVYLLSCNLSEVLVVSLAVASGGPLPLLPLQILFLNLVTDVFPALALGMGQGAPDRLRRPPRDPKEAVLARRHWVTIGVYGLLLAGAVLAAFGLALGPLDLEARGAVTVSFLTLATSQLVHVFNMRRRTSGMLVNEITQNPWVWGALGLCVAILAAAAAIPAAARLLALERLSPTAWLVVLSLSLAPVVVVQTADALRRAWRWLRRRRAAGSDSPIEGT